jgi:hypothetical protein
MCEFLKNDKKCCKKVCYGNYCKTHRREHLVANNFIIINNFTGKSPDYLKDDILSTLNSIDKKKHNRLLKKGELFTTLTNKIEKLNHYTTNTESIKLIQSRYKKRYNDKNIKMRGMGFIDRKLCNNIEDFYTYETVNEIDDKYFFSYKDEKDIVWFFDIRSLNKLIEMNQPNPYTMQEFGLYIVWKAQKLIDHLKNNNISIEFVDEMKEVKKDKKKILKQKMTDVFASIERLGYSFNNEWFTTLHILQLKKLYSLMEDIWNYRAQLTPEMKRQLCPPDGLIFNKSVIEIRNVTNRDQMRDYILTDINKFNSAVSDNDKKTGFMYFLISLSKVNYRVLETHPWMASV